MSCIGTCEFMCPPKEADLRKRLKRLSVFEKHGKCVKEYARCAAGSTRASDELRTPQALQKTTNYLISLLEIKDHGYNWITTTNFITDRLRAVRQDTIIQQLTWKTAVPILQKIIRYHIFIRFTLHRETLRDFDPALNDQLLQSYLGDLFEYYHFIDQKKILYSYDEFQTYRLLLNLTNQQFIGEKMKDFLNEGFLLDLHHPGNGLAHACYLSLLYQNGNYLRFFREVSRLTFLESCCLLYHISSIRAAFLSVISHAYCNKHFSVSIEIIVSWFHFDKREHLISFLKCFEIPHSEGQVFFREKKQYTLKPGQEKQDVIKKCTYNKLVESKMGYCFDVVCVVNGGWLIDD